MALLLVVFSYFFATNIYRLFPDFRMTERLLRTMQEGHMPDQNSAALELGKRRDPASIEPLLLLIKDPSAGTRRNAVYGLCMMKDPRIFNAFLNALKDTDREVREIAVRGIALSRDPRTLEVLYSALFKDEAVAEMAAEALALMPYDMGIPMLVKAFENPDPRLQYVLTSAVIALNGIHSKPEPFTQALMTALKSGPRELRLRAIVAMRFYQDARIFEALIQGMADPDPEVRSYAKRLLKEREMEDQRVFLFFHPDVEKKLSDHRWLAVKNICERGDPRDALLIAGFLKENDYALRYAAASAMVAIGDPRTVPVLKTAVRKNKELYLTLGIVLDKLHDPQALDAFKSALQNPTTRNKAAENLARMKNPQAKELLVAEYEFNPTGRNELLSVIKESGNPYYSEISIRALKDKDPAVRRAAAESLAVIPDPAAEDLLLSYRNDKDSDMKTAVMAALAKMRSSKAVPLLIKDLESYEGARYAVPALGKIGDKRAIPYLREIFNNRCEYCMEDAAVALGDIGDRESIPALLDALEDPSLHVQRGAVRALGLLKERKAVKPLIKFLDRKYCDFRETAAYALGEIGDPIAVPNLAEHLPDIDIMKSVVAALAKLHWQPRTDRETTYMRVCQNKWDEIAADWTHSRAVLVKDLQEKNPDVRAGAAAILVAIGAKDTLKELLEAIAADKENDLAFIYYNSGFSQLRNAAVSWALQNGVDYRELNLAMLTNSEEPPLIWGGRNITMGCCSDYIGD
jgi:HEAT repeat protein